MDALVSAVALAACNGSNFSRDCNAVHGYLSIVQYCIFPVVFTNNVVDFSQRVGDGGGIDRKEKDC